MSVLEGTRITLERYKELLKEVTPENRADNNPLSLEHIAWMIDECLANLDTVDLYKSSRWLGFIQYGLTYYEYIKVSEERDTTRPLFTDEAKEETCNLEYMYCHPHNGEYWYRCTTCGATDWFARYNLPEKTHQLTECTRI